MMGATKRRAVLALADGTIFEGDAFGAQAEVIGELNFHTSPTGYQELLSDPGAAGRLYVFAYPEIGNVGVHEGDRESERVYAAGVIVRHLAEAPASHLAERSLEEELVAFGVPGIEGIDTRRLVRKIRDGGPQLAVLSTKEGADAAALVEKARVARRPSGSALVQQVSTRTSYEVAAKGERRLHVVALDFGIKRATLRALSSRGCAVTVLPSAAQASQVLELRPDGVLLSGGPGDPEAAASAAVAVKELLGKVPLFGIGFGNLVLAAALGAKGRVGEGRHPGSNHPVQELASGRVAITSHADRLIIDPTSLEGTGAVITHAGVNDGAIEGIAHDASRAFGVQFHPEGSPGPNDAANLFDRFVEAMEVAR